MRRGVGLVEILLALLVLAGLLLAVFDMIRSSTAVTRHGRERATARMVLLDLVSMLQGFETAELETRVQEAQLTELLRGRITLLPEPERKAYEDQIKGVVGKVKGKIEDLGDDTRPGLVKLVLTAEVPGHDPVQVATLFRPNARILIAGSPDGQCVGGAASAP